MSDKKILETLKKKPVLVFLVSLVIILGLILSMELLAPTNVKPSVLAGFGEKTESVVELEEEEKTEVEVNSYEECEKEDGITSTTEDGQEICTFGEKSYTKKEQNESEELEAKEEPKDDSQKPAEPTNSEETITYTNPSFPNLKIPYNSSWSLTESDERQRGTGLYTLEFSKRDNLLRIEIISLPRTSFPTTCFQQDKAQIVEQIRGVDNYHNSAGSEGNTFFEPASIYKIKDPYEKEGYDFQYKALKKVTEGDRQLISSGSNFIRDCTMESEYKETFILTEVAGTDNSFYADVAFYLRSQDSQIMNEVDNLIKNLRL